MSVRVSDVHHRSEDVCISRFGNNFVHYIGDNICCPLKIPGIFSYISGVEGI